MTTVISCVGARPNFMKIAPIIRALNRHGGFQHRLVHTGQHSEDTMSQAFVRDLSIPQPEFSLNIPMGPRALQIASVIERLTPILRKERPDFVLVVGDVNSTLAAAQAALRESIPAVHVEAGLRSFDSAMPEEINRIETDRISRHLFVSEPSGMKNLSDERVAGDAHLVGNVMIDSLATHLDDAAARLARLQFGLQARSYIVCTFHRPQNVDTADSLHRLAEVLRFACARTQVVFPMHPRTRDSLGRHGLTGTLAGMRNLILTQPMGYLDFLSLVHDSKGVLTDSGGIQEETTYLGIGCVTARDNTERPITTELGTNLLAGTAPEGIMSALELLLRQGRRDVRIPLWDGHAAERIVQILAS